MAPKKQDGGRQGTTYKRGVHLHRADASSAIFQRTILECDIAALERQKLGVPYTFRVEIRQVYTW